MSCQTASQFPAVVRPFFQYNSDSYITQALQFTIEGFHGFDIPYVPSIVLTGLALRVLTAPAHVYAENLFAKQIHSTMFLKREVLKKIAAQYQLPIVLDPTTQRPKLGHASAELNQKAEQIVNSTIRKYHGGEGLTEMRIRCLKIFSIPLWISSSFAIRNILFDSLPPHTGGLLWITSFSQPDQYFVLPIICGVISFLNFYSQRMVFPNNNSKTVMLFDGLTGFMTACSVFIMCQMPAVLPAFWATVSLTGLIQSLLLRHPKVKGFFGIKKLPWDTRTPFRDLFFIRGLQKSAAA